MTVVFWILMLFLLLVFIACLCDSCNSKFDVKERMIDLTIAIVAFTLMLILKMCWR